MCEAFPKRMLEVITKAVALWMSQFGKVCFIEMHSFDDNAGYRKRHNLQIVQLYNHECE